MNADQYFKVIDGTVLKSFEDLVSTLGTMSESVFNYHANNQKNDFANWIEGTLKRRDIAEEIRNIVSRKQMLLILEKYVSKKVLVLNAGSSSLKYQLIDAETEQAVLRGKFECIGKKMCSLTITAHNQTLTKPIYVQTHDEAVKLALKSLIAFHVIQSLDEISMVGHRVVHGGENFSLPTVITPEVKAEIEKLCEIAPLHNPINLVGIKACEEQLPGKKQVAVFDTAFHASIPTLAFLYGIPFELYKKFGIRKYGFHGISNQYVSKKSAEILQKDDHEVIICHLGNGSSITAVKDGKSVDTSMGFTPLDGLIMGTRSGELDPEVVFFLLKKHYTIEQLESLLNTKSGLQGITGLTGDVKELRELSVHGNQVAQLALDMLSYRISLFVGAYMTILKGLDAIVFTGGIGENAWYIREKVCDNLGFVGLKLDKQKNEKNAVEISASDSTIKVLVVPTDEELEIARECLIMDKKVG